MSKKRILLCGEATFINSGYANYGCQIMNRLYQTGEFELAEIGCFGKDHSSVPKPPWKIYYPKEDNGAGRFGSSIFEDVLLEFKPDVVWSFRDPWIDDFIGDSPYKRHFHWAYMPTIDSIPLDPEWIYTLTKADSIFTYSDWALDILKENYPNLNLISSASPAADEVFTMIKDKKEFKKSHGLDPDCLIIGSVMRNQKRKLIPDLFDAFEMLLDQAPKEISSKLILYMHTTYPDVGWDIPKLIAERPKISKKLFFTYSCRVCFNISISNFNGAIIQCNHCKKTSSLFPNTSSGAKRDSMAMVYNLMDLYVQYSCAEGFGMPLVEAASCGVPICATDYSAMYDIVRKLDGFPIKVQRMHYEVETHRKFALPDNQNFVDICIKYFKQPESVRKFKSNKTLNLAKEKYSYDAVSEKLKNHFLSIPSSNTWNEPKRYMSISSQILFENNSDFLKQLLKCFNDDFSLLFSKFLKKMNYNMSSKEDVCKEVEKIVSKYNHYESIRN
jgi:glycosyltransferase involved in cell wall biosynthesis